MLFIDDLMKMVAGSFLAMGTNVGVSSMRVVVIAVALSSCLTETFALPALSPSPNLSLAQVNTSSPLVLPYPRPPEKPVCPSTQQWGATLGHPSYRDCNYILSNLYPQDPLAKPVTRNFYTAPADVSQTMSNLKLPYEQSYSITAPSLRLRSERHVADTLLETCNIQLLLATDFNDIPHDEATWNDLRGAARTIFRGCIQAKGLGGVVTKNGTSWSHDFHSKRWIL